MSDEVFRRDDLRLEVHGDKFVRVDLDHADLSLLQELLGVEVYEENDEAQELWFRISESARLLDMSDEDSEVG